jgi:hypothetical protein
VKVHDLFSPSTEPFLPILDFSIHYLVLCESSVAEEIKDRGNISASQSYNALGKVSKGSYEPLHDSTAEKIINPYTGLLEPMEHSDVNPTKNCMPFERLSPQGSGLKNQESEETVPLKGKINHAEIFPLSLISSATEDSHSISAVFGTDLENVTDGCVFAARACVTIGTEPALAGMNNFINNKMLPPPPDSSPPLKKKRKPRKPKDKIGCEGEITCTIQSKHFPRDKVEVEVYPNQNYFVHTLV